MQCARFESDYADRLEIEFHGEESIDGVFWIFFNLEPFYARFLKQNNMKDRQA
jgi:hypothetical protein